ncbi:arrestin domain-containing protein 3-like [Trichomycterus rosablanca]|uniref:arrestin domain-containing protein 3-like n=1 Tax=Trichomycterus rosablanca TaxID=2290929 RepID=UPI002F35C3EA
MSGTIKELSLTYDAVNSSNTFSSGDVINGKVILEVSKEVKVDSLFIKCKGGANVHWSERHNDNTRNYSSHERYFKVKQYFIQDPSKKGNEDPGVVIMGGETYSNVIKPGNHVYPFSLQLPQGNFPASFNGNHGSVKYILEVTLDRSWKMDRTVKQEINFVPRFHGDGSILLNPQSGAVDKKMKLFSSGSASFKATINKMGYMPGEVIKVSTSVDNSSSRDLKPKYSLDQTQTFCAEGHTKHFSQNIFKVVGDPISSKSNLTLNTDLTIPPNLNLTIANCGIIKVEYLFKVYLDVPYASDPEVLFPVTILPAQTFFAPWPNQPGFQPPGIPGGPGWTNPSLQPGFGPGAPTGPAPVPGLYPNIYPPPVNPDPGAPPPSYGELYANSGPNPTAPGFNSTAPVPPFSHPQYPVMGYPYPSVPEQHPAPSAPAYIPGEGAPGYWPNPTNPNNQPDPFPTKTPEKQE